MLVKPGGDDHDEILLTTAPPPTPECAKRGQGRGLCQGAAGSGTRRNRPEDDRRDDRPLRPASVRRLIDHYARRECACAGYQFNRRAH
jgi:hypothetical protein